MQDLPDKLVTELKNPYPGSKLVPGTHQRHGEINFYQKIKSTAAVGCLLNWALSTSPQTLITESVGVFCFISTLHTEGGMKRMTVSDFITIHCLTLAINHCSGFAY